MSSHPQKVKKWGVLSILKVIVAHLQAESWVCGNFYIIKVLYKRFILHNFGRLTFSLLWLTPLGPLLSPETGDFSPKPMYVLLISDQIYYYENEVSYHALIFCNLLTLMFLALQLIWQGGKQGILSPSSCMYYYLNEKS